MKTSVFMKNSALLLFLFILESGSAFCFQKNFTHNALNYEIEAEHLIKKWNKDSLFQADDLLNKALKVWQGEKNFAREVVCLRRMASLKLELDQTDESQVILQKALKISTAHRLFDEKAEILSDLSILSLKLGNVEQSRRYFVKSLQAAKISGRHSALAAAYFSAGEFYYWQSDLKTAHDYYNQSLEFYYKSGDQESLATVLLTLGYLKLEQNDFSVSKSYLDSALAKWQSLGSLRGEALTNRAFAAFYDWTNEKQKALEYYKKVEAVFPTEIDSLEATGFYGGFGQFYESLGDLKLSKNYREKALHSAVKINNYYGQVIILPELARVSMILADDERAFLYLNQAQLLAIKLKDDFLQAQIKRILGDYYFRKNSFTQAKNSYTQSLRYFENNKRKREIGQTTERLGQISLSENRFDLARRYFEKSLNASHSIQDKYAEAQILGYLSNLDRLENNDLSALVKIENSIELTENLYSDVNSSKLKSTYFSNVFDRYELYIHLLMKKSHESETNEFAVNALQAAEKSRARSILENLSLSQTDLIKDASPELLIREKEIRVLLNSKSDKLTDFLNNADLSQTENLDDEINRLEYELEEIKVQLKEQSPVYSAIKNPAPFDVSEFQDKILDENSLLLEFSFGKDESYLWLIGKNEISSYVLPPRIEIEDNIEKLRELIGSREMRIDEELAAYQARINAAENEYKTESRKLSRILFGQTSDKISNKRLIIVPDGKLNYFPVSALPFPNSDTDEPILLTNETVYEPSAQTLLLLEKTRNQYKERTKDLLIFSDPIFTIDDVRFSPENKPVENPDSEKASIDKLRFVESLNSLPRLAASKNESDSIINILGTNNADNYSGFTANREELLNVKADNYKIIHFATHGSTDEKRPELSGIVLSRFDEKGQPRDEFFRIHDIYGLNLNADLVVLSACETGIGKEIKGEGLMSLNNAFLQTGAKSVMASLWKVEDTATLELMKKFYELMANEKLTPPQALRQAQISLRRNPRYKSPFYWAAFTIQGDFQNVPKLSNGNSNRWYLLLILPLMLIGIYLFRKKIFKQN